MPREIKQNQQRNEGYSSQNKKERQQRTSKILRTSKESLPKSLLV